jgi:flagellar hook-associated protein 1 FlgK
MAGLTSTLEIAKNTMLNQQLQIQTATHNIANADNKSYARQRANAITNPASPIGAGWIGNGARIDHITQFRDQYIEKQLMGSISQESDYRTRSTLLGTISSYLSDDGTQGLSQDLGAFWDSWDALSQNPQGLVEKDGVVAAASNLVDSIHNAQAGLTDVRHSIQQSIETEDSAGNITGGVIRSINDLISQVGDFNRQISSMESTGNSANDLRDQRYQALTELSGYIGIDTAEQANGAVTVTLTDSGTPITLVSGQHYGALDYTPGSNQVSYTDASVPPVSYSPSPNVLSGGSLSGMLATVAKTTDYETLLDTFASTLVDQVNTQYDNTGTLKVFDGNRADNIEVNSAITLNPSSIDGTKALDLAELQDTPVAALGNTRFIDYLGNLQGQIGQDQSSATSQADFQQSLSLQLGAQQQSLSGVSIDEETIDLLKFQQVYQAAAKIIQRTDEMLQTVIDMV